ncbi:cell division protein FtsK [Kribbella sandramycini]|uniref:Cell division protein FtsK n=1 Tax=Kribbella sandramycini TaxID=60450 RepID=A0A7Y4L4I8_9ACTN|nr:FtsK/SpoIIIE domain-containing protein [Kribbella sandramycini]MBB6571569.1 S-DNA-T family DNA segregation ATPase FtsK/SpoIIIE [Kribbella sandramycini]NOL44215.1 cell division protein FtsK [Kribbella sandramycini]
MSSFKSKSVFPRRKPGVTPAPKGALSIYDPIYMGLDTRGRAVRVTLMYRNILIGGEPGAGKSVAQGNIVAHAALCSDVDLILIDGKIVELLPYAPVADEFVGNDMRKALRVLRDLQTDLDERYLHLARTGRKKIVPGDGFRAKLLCVDELAYFTVTVGTKDQQEEFRVLVRDIVARGRAAGIITVASTQRPSADIVPTSLRDLFGYRLAFRCATDSSSDIILGTGWSSQGHSAVDIEPEALGVGLLRAEGGFPRRLKTAFLNDRQHKQIVRRAVHLRRAA